MSGNLPKVFLRVFPSMSGKVRSEYGYIGLEGPKVISIFDNEFEDTVNFCLYSQIFGGSTDQRYVLHCFCSDELRFFINGGSTVLFFQDEIKFQNHTMVGTAAEPGVVPKALGLIFGTLADFLPEDCEFKLSKNLGKIYRLTEVDKELEKAIRNKIFTTKKQNNPETSGSNNVPSFRPFLYKTLKIDLGKNYLWASSFAIFDNNVYDLLEAVSKNGPPHILNWRNKVSGEFPLSYLCRNVHVLTKTEALHLFMVAKSNFEKSLSKNYFDSKRSVFIYCLTNLRHRKEKTFAKVSVNTFACVSFPGLASVAVKSLSETADYIASIITLWHQMKMRPSFKEQVPLKKNNLFQCFLRNVWVGNREISLIINLRVEAHKYDKIATLIRSSCLKEISVDGLNIKEILPIKTDKQPKKPKKRMQKENLADDVRFSITLKWNNIKENLEANFNQEELKSNNAIFGNKNPFLVVDFIVDSDNQRRITFPELNRWFTKRFEADIEEIKLLKIKVLILKYLESIFEELLEESRTEFEVAKKVCIKVKSQLMVCGKLDEAQKSNVLTVIQKKIESIIYGPMSFQTLQELVYLREIVSNDFQYI